LPADTYVFKTLDSQPNCHIAQVFSKDETTIYAMILAVPNDRLKATGKTAITFSQKPADQPEALTTSFYPGSASGEEFVFPKATAMNPAKATNAPIPVVSAEIPLEVAQPFKLVSKPMVIELMQLPIRAIRPNGEEVQLAQVVARPPPTQAPVAAIEDALQYRKCVTDDRVVGTANKGRSFRRPRKTKTSSVEAVISCEKTRNR